MRIIKSKKNKLIKTVITLLVIATVILAAIPLNALQINVTKVKPPIKRTGYGEDFILTTMTGITAEELAPFMHPDTRHLAELVVKICEENEIAPEFIAAVIRYEHIDGNNLFSWRKNDGDFATYKSEEECIKKVIPNIKKMYLTEGGECFNGYTVPDVAIKYCPGDPIITEDGKKIPQGDVEWIVKIAEETQKVIDYYKKEKAKKNDEIPQPQLSQLPQETQSN